MKTEKITIRLTSDEKQMILKESETLNISYSEYMRLILRNNNITNSAIGKNIVNTPENICNLFTEIQRLRQPYQNIDLDELERRVVKLCQ